jgi:SynChlorMet cassette protein ScmC
MPGDSGLKIALGPLRYELIAHDAWAKELLSLLEKNLCQGPFRAVSPRVLHLLEFQPTSRQRQEIAAGILPARFRNLAVDAPRSGWTLLGDGTGHVCWLHPDSDQLFWTFNTESPHARAVYQLPWPLLVQDILDRGGGVLHGGLAVFRRRAYLFSAPPGGGKTTTLTRLPHEWKVLADDAMLIWPDNRGGSRASPLPTWSVLLGVNPMAFRGTCWRVSASFPVQELVFLKKSRIDDLSPLTCTRAIPMLFRALSEYPGVLPNLSRYNRNIFFNACALSRIIPASELRLTRNGRFWDLFSKKG